MHSGSGNPTKSGNDQNQQGASPGSQQNEVSNSGVSADPTVIFLKNMMELARQGKVFNCDYPVKTTNMDTVEKVWGKADQTQYVAATKGSYATFETYRVVFGFNKGGQIFEAANSVSPPLEHYNVLYPQGTVTVWLMIRGGNGNPARIMNIPFDTTTEGDAARYTFPVEYDGNTFLYYVLSCKWQNGNETELTFAVQG